MTEVMRLRPKFLEIEGLQSFKDKQIVDFDKLGETGLFGIFGPTGSGKSTILDGITLALYGNVQRAGRGTQGIMNADENTVYVSFTFELLKEGGRKSYKVERTYKRKKDSDSSVEVKLARLFEIAAGNNLIIADKPAEVTQKIEELLGLQLEDFTRSVVLPQNKFQEFLLLDKAKKRDMMERIFYLEEYGRNLSEKVNRKLSSIKLKLSEIEGAMSMLGDVSEKALIESERKLFEVRKLRESIDEQLKITEIQYIQAKEVWDITTEFQEVSDREKDHLTMQRQVKCNKEQYERAIKADKMSEIIGKYEEILTLLHDTKHQLDMITSQIPELEENLQKSKSEYDEVLKTRLREQPLLVERKTKLLDALHLSKEVIGIDEELVLLREQYKARKSALEEKEKLIEKAKFAIEEKQNNINALKQEIEGSKVDIEYKKLIDKGVRLEEELDNTRTEIVQLKVQKEELSTKTALLAEVINKLLQQKTACSKDIIAYKVQLEQHVILMPENKDMLMQELTQLHEQKTLLDGLKIKHQALNLINEKLEKLNLEKIRITNEYVQSVDKKGQINREIEGLKNELDKLKSNIEIDSAHLLSKLLVEGSPCPVCGSSHHPNPAPSSKKSTKESESGKLEQKLEQLELAEQIFKEQETSCIRIEEQLKTMENQIGQLIMEKLSMEKDIEKHLSNMQEEFYNLDINQIDIELDRKDQIYLNKLKALEDWDKKSEELKNCISDIDVQLSKLTIDESSKQVEYKFQKASLQQKEEALNKLLDDHSRIKESFIKLQEEVSIGDRYNHGINNFHGKKQLMEDGERQRNELEKRLYDEEESLRVLRITAEDLLTQRQSLGVEFDEVRTQGEILRSKKEEKENKLLGIAGNENIEQAIIKVESSLTAFQDKEQKLNELLKELEDKYNKACTTKQMLLNQHDIYKSSLSREEKLLFAGLKENNFLDIEDAQKAKLSNEYKESLKTNIEKFEEELKSLKTQKEILQKKLGDRSITEEAWKEAERIYKEKLELKERGISDYESAKNTFANIKNSFDRWIILNDQKIEKSRKKELLEQIQKLLKGNSFVEYISEERLRYIAREASDTLGVLTKFKYALELDTENGFVIRDNANGGVCRMVSSLSGGETFLTSLSLALALSSQIQLKGQSPLEFFFLDEGFGTLDSSLLDTVVDSLERLSDTNRVIGLISHVPELKHRISRRLIVEPPVPGGFGSRVTIEKA
ncbi:MAG: putative exonuclease [Clostridiales bacterium]|nr:putative exonuclease [Clostridiales bacterium]